MDVPNMLRPQISLEVTSDEVDTAVQYKQPAPIHVNTRHLKPSGGGRLQLPPLDIKAANKLRPSTSFGDLASDELVQDQSTLSQRRLRLKKGLSENGPGPAKELRSLSIALPPNSHDTVSHLVSPLPSHKQFRHTDSIQRYDDEEVSLLNQYHLEEIIGHGSYGVVRRATTGDSNEVKALKIVSKKKLTRKLYPPRRRSTPNPGNSPPVRNDPMAGIYREIAILKKLDHPHVVKLLEVMDDSNEDEIILVFEYIERGPLMDDKLGKTFPEDQARGYFIQLMLGLEYLHHQKVIHRDIKPSNLLVADDNKIKIADFGVSETFNTMDSDVQLTKSAGTPAFMAPECLDTEKRSYLGKKVDIWAAGVTLYCMMYGKVPFFHPILPELHELIKTQELTFPDSPPSSHEIRDLMECMMDKDPVSRISMDEIRIHPWIKKSGMMIPSKSQNCLEVIDPQNDEVIGAVKKTTYPIYILTLIRGMARRRSLRNPMADLSPKSKHKNDRQSSPVPVTSPTTPGEMSSGTASPKRRGSFKSMFRPRSRTPEPPERSPPLPHRPIPISSPLAISSNSPPISPSNSPPRSPVMTRSNNAMCKSNSLLNITHTATSMTSNSTSSLEEDTNNNSNN